MSERPHGINPDQVVRIFEQPLDEAAITFGLAEHRLQAARDSAEEAQIKLAKAEFTYEFAQQKQDNLRAAGRAALSAAEGYPADAMFRAQMQIEGRPEKADEVLDHIAAINDYARTNNALIAVSRVTYTIPIPAARRIDVDFYAPVDGDTEPLSLWQDNDGSHRLKVQTENAVSLLSRGTVANSMDVFTALSVTELAFAASPQEVGKALSEDKPTVIYGDECVHTFIKLMARDEGLRPSLYQAMGQLQRNYDVPPMETPEARQEASFRFTNELVDFVNQLIHSRETDTFLLTPETQSFVGVSDEEMIRGVERTLSWWGYVDERAVPHSALFKVNRAWDEVWDQLRAQGFTELTDRMIQPAQAAHSVAEIERRIISETMDNNDDLLRQRRLKKALKAVEAKLNDLEDFDGSSS